MDTLLTINTKEHNEQRQGEAFAPFVLDTNEYKKLFYIESYGCAMNFADSEVVASILQKNGFGATLQFEKADLILVNTCSIREKAEATVRKRLTEFRKLKKANPGLLVGVLGCMAERLKEKFIEQERLVDLVVGPDAYRTLPSLIEEAETGQKAVNVLLSRDETYADIAPVRLNSNGVNAFVSIMRGCNNMCSFCVVPFTRGRERSRDPQSIVKECTDLFNQGYREVTLLGQNVDSYKWNAEVKKAKALADVSNEELQEQFLNGIEKTDSIGAKNALSFGEGRAEAVNFANLLEMVALIHPDLRVRFSTSHPKDITDEVLYTIAKYENICNYIHLPVQSGNSRILELMNRTYTREWYINRIDAIRRIIPGCGISTDIITGFCTETDEEHDETISMMDYVKYDFAYMFTYSERPGTLAAKRYADDVPELVKSRRLTQVVAKQQEYSFYRMQQQLGKVQKVLIENYSKKSPNDYCGRNDQNAMVVFPVDPRYKLGEYAHVIVERTTTATLIGKIVPPSPLKGEHQE